jgi:hypothetical protein
MKRKGETVQADLRGVGASRRTGTIAEVLGGPEHPRYLVRWADGRETILYGEKEETTTVSTSRKSRPPAKKRPRGRRSLPEAGPTAEPGDRLVVRPHHLGEPERDAEVLEVLGGDGHAPFRVRWEDTGAETLLFPGTDAHVEHYVHEEAKRADRS